MSSSSKGYFARVMGTMWRHKRTSALSMGARGLWVSMLSWSADQMSDGLVEAHAMEMIFRGKVDKKLVDELIAAQVIAKAEEGWQLRDWDQHNITRAKYETQLKQGNERVSKSRARTGESVTKKAETLNETPPVTRYKPVTFADGNAFPSDQDQDQEQEQDSLGVRGERAPEVPVSSSTSPTAHAELVRQAWVAEFKSRGLAVDRRLHALTDTEFVKFADGVTLELFKANIARWFADPAMVDAGYPVGWFMSRPNQWGPKAKATTRDGGEDRQRPSQTKVPSWMGGQP